MPEVGATDELVERALAYPYAVPGGPFVQVGERTLEGPPGDLDLADRRPLLAYGSNAAPEALARKLATEPPVPLPLVRADLSDFDVVYSAHISPYGAVPATLQRSAGTTVAVFVAFPTDEQLSLLSATEPNYRLARLRQLACRLESGESLTELDAFLSRHGCLLAGGSEIAVAGIEARSRALAAMSQRQVQDRVRDALAPGLSLERFIAGSADPELTARRTATLRQSARPLVGQTAAKRRRARRAISP
jgi:hypothetical protein